MKNFHIVVFLGVPCTLTHRRTLEKAHNAKTPRCALFASRHAATNAIWRTVAQQPGIEKAEYKIYNALDVRDERYQ